MNTIGLIGGMSWESTQTYYQLINQGVKKHLGGLHSAKILLSSVDFAEIEKLQHLARWSELETLMLKEGLRLQQAGANAIAICTNTMHKAADTLETKLDIPLIHIADATAGLLLKKGTKTVGLLGTKFTMEQSFYAGRLTDKFGIKVIIPPHEQRDMVHRIIYEELCLGQIKSTSAEQYLDVISQLKKNGASAVILGCTEIGLLVQQPMTSVDLLDTTEIHAQAIVKWLVNTNTG